VTDLITRTELKSDRLKKPISARTELQNGKS